MHVNTPVPDDEFGANRILGRRAYLAERRKKLDALRADAVAVIDEWHGPELERLNGELELIDDRLRVWHTRHMQQGGGATVSLPFGKVKFNPLGAGQSDITDNEALVAWVEENYPKAVKKKLPEVDLTVLRKAFKPPEAEPNSSVPLIDPGTGEAIPGLVINYQERKWGVSHD